MGKKYNLPGIFKKKADEYFRECDKSGKPYTFSGVCLKLGICKQSFHNYSKDIQFLDSTRYIKLKIENYLEEAGLENRINSRIVMFTLKNNFDWQDKTIIEQPEPPKVICKEEVDRLLASVREKERLRQLQAENEDEEQEA